MGEGFHVMAKPTGARCNLDCAYCFYLSRMALYPDSQFRMADDVLEAYIGQLLAAQPTGEVVITWQGGEPTLLGLDFMRRATALAERRRRPGQHLVHTLQTNGVLLDAAWAAFFKAHDFLVGISIDGPAALHDAYRTNRGGRGTFQQVMRGLRHLQAQGVSYNVLTTVNAANGAHPLAVYRFLRDECAARYIQFIPVVEHLPAGGVSTRSVGAHQYGVFLIAVFEEWRRYDARRVQVQMFEAAIANWLGQPPTLCVHAPTCGRAVALEHTGDVYSCDHFVAPEFRLGNILATDLIRLVESPQQQAFGQAKQDSLPAWCRRCPVVQACQGGCPKDRFMSTPEGEPGLNYLCAGYQVFFAHVRQALTAAGALPDSGG